MDAETDPGNLFALMRPPRVCICRQVSEDDIRRAVERGAHTFEAVQQQTDCSTGCGTCEQAVRALIRRYLPEGS
ncbi:MAG: (2Fe-2S)-binding protein [Spirochaetales bacterium]|nr:(2Fe-2S)-binding protein [Leptospiraceae bacterium]MCP5481927.1 (2Fe-2S)-binding protein [Spirochaetales bacterium]